MCEAMIKVIEDIEAQDDSILIEGLVDKYRCLWENSRETLPPLDYRVGMFRKLINEIKTNRFMNKLNQRLMDSITCIDDKKWREDFLGEINALEKGIIGEELRAFDFFSLKGYPEITEDFIKTAKEFDSNIQLYDVSQALRNVWIMNSIQVLFDMKVALRPSIFSYSMLYPYSDNYIDDPEIKLEEKLSFSKGLRKRLQGMKIKPNNQNEDKIYKLISKIEEEYPRHLYPKVYEALLLIHMAQEKSFTQQKQYNLGKTDVLSISIEKGGSSVLADGYLVKGRLNRKEDSFTFGYGVLLQFIDDLQDIKTDFNNLHETIFTRALVEGQLALEAVTNKLFWYIEEILNNDIINKSKDAVRLGNIIKKSCSIMILEAVADNKDLYSREYIKRLEEYSLFRLVYYRRLKKKLQNIFNNHKMLLLSKALQDKIEVREEC